MTPTLLLRGPTGARAIPLAGSTLVGRHWACLARMDDPRVPLLWLELRWFGTRWGWRALGAHERTRGSGANLADGWRHLAAGASLRLDDVVSVELVSETAPVLMLVDPQTGTLATPEVFERTVEVLGGRMLPLAAEGDPSEALDDGVLLVLDGRSWRVCLPEAPASTVQARLHCDRPYDLFLDESGTSVSFIQGAASAGVTGECVRVLAVFVEARRGDLPRGGWLSPTEAWDAWVARGGASGSPIARIAWERAKLRQALARQGVAGLDALFEVERLPHVKVRWRG